MAQFLVRDRAKRVGQQFAGILDQVKLHLEQETQNLTNPSFFRFLRVLSGISRIVAKGGDLGEFFKDYVTLPVCN